MLPARDPKLKRTVLKLVTLVQIGQLPSFVISLSNDLSIQKEDTIELVVGWPEQWYPGGSDNWKKIDSEHQRKHCYDIVPGAYIQVFAFKDTSDGHEKNHGHKQCMIRVRAPLAPKYHQSAGKKGAMLWYAKQPGITIPHFEGVWIPTETGGTDLVKAHAAGIALKGFEGFISCKRGLGARYLPEEFGPARLSLRPKDDRYDAYTAPVITLFNYRVEGVSANATPCAIATELRLWGWTIVSQRIYQKGTIKCMDVGTSDHPPATTCYSDGFVQVITHLDVEDPINVMIVAPTTAGPGATGIATAATIGSGAGPAPPGASPDVCMRTGGEGSASSSTPRATIAKAVVGDTVTKLTIMQGALRLIQMDRDIAKKTTETSQ